MPFRLVWPLLAAILGFALGGSAFWGLYGPNTTIQQIAHAEEPHGSEQKASEEREKPDESLARYTWWLTAFTGMLMFATMGLGVATIGLYLTGEKQVGLSRIAATAAGEAAEAARR